MNETWLPLLEKAYAELHGCYQAIDGGSISALEDVCGGYVYAMDPSSLWENGEAFWLQTKSDF